MRQRVSCKSTHYMFGFWRAWIGHTRGWPGFSSKIHILEPPKLLLGPIGLDGLGWAGSSLSPWSRSVCWPALAQLNRNSLSLTLSQSYKYIYASLIRSIIYDDWCSRIWHVARTWQDDNPDESVWIDANIVHDDHKDSSSLISLFWHVYIYYLGSWNWLTDTPLPNTRWLHTTFYIIFVKRH